MTGNTFVPHPDDQAALDQLADDFAAHRAAAGISQQSLARVLGVDRSTVAVFETRRPCNPLASTLQRYGEPVGLSLRLTVAGFDTIPAPPAAAALVAGGFPGTAAVAHLRAARESLGLVRTDIQARHGWSWSALASFETSDREPLVSMLQRYARALGGLVVPSWEESC